MSQRHIKLKTKLGGGDYFILFINFSKYVLKTWLDQEEASKGKVSRQSLCRRKRCKMRLSGMGKKSYTDFILLNLRTKAIIIQKNSLKCYSFSMKRGP